jgi:sialate O-acetylesterase
MNARIKLKILIVIFLFVIAPATFCRVKLPKLVSDGMVLQRDARVKIWGWASAGEKITLHFIDSIYHTTAKRNGEWEVVLPNMKAGGPYVMQIQASDSVIIQDIMVGDVWVCSGQSNMGMTLGSLANVYPEEINNSGNKYIRQFSVPININFTGRERDLKISQWQCADPKNVRSFTAVGYFFAKKIFDIYKIPLGIIHASLGGSSAEAWMSEKAIKQFPKYFEDAQRLKNPSFIEKIKKLDDERYKNWYALLRQNDEGYKDPEQLWTNPKLNISHWETMPSPGYWENTKLGAVNGVVWFRKEVVIPSDMAGRPATLKLGRIIDIDSVFINGTYIGTTGSQYAPRFYNIPANLLREGENTIVVRIIDNIRHGGFVPGKQYEISVGEKVIDLTSEWKYRLGTTAEPLEDRLFTGKISTGLFNGMIAPIINYTMKGVLWYQGESNTSRAFEHFNLFKSLIKDWRENWQQGAFPFLFVQLPNFVEVNVEATPYDWAYFRESQLKALSIPNTGMAVTIDIGEFNDIHPVNKMDVGYRLALIAQKIAYGDKQVVSSGPMYQSMKVHGNNIILSFTQIGSGLVVKNGVDLNCFELCGIDNTYYPAKARIENGTIVVWCDEVTAPVAVRYAWANNPEGANLYNKEGLPATPFRTSELY